MTYYLDVDKGCIVRKADEGVHLEYTFKGAKGWLQTEHDSAYEREYWLGEGNTCLRGISEKEALEIMASWTEVSDEKKVPIAAEKTADLPPHPEITGDLIGQMVDGIAGKESENPTEREKEIRRRLSGRALEYLMFMDD